ncbi:MAG: cation transporter [Parvularculaceae bacterium]|nr:cation transporter [Parvularculaceae bacterium]
MSDCGHDFSVDGIARHRADGGRLIAALAVILVFMVLEIIGGVISGSLALLADAAHMMTDAFALALAASAHWMSARPANGQLHFGYRRVQVVAAFVNGIALLLLTGWILVEAFRRSVSPIDVAWAPMLAIAALGLVANGIAFRLLHQAGDHNINIKSAMLHVVSDFLGSVAAVIAAITIWLTGWTRIDPILSVFVALLIGRLAVKLLKETTHILLEGAPTNIDAERMEIDLASISPDIEDIHSVKVWQITPDQPRLTLHARLRAGAGGDEALSLLKRALSERYGIRESTIQIEIGGACPDHRGDHAREGAQVHTLHAHGRGCGGVATAR